ncbi:MAG: HD domain-containing protein [Planctomycetota bacterium]|jgi:3'-5' exoribonuclease|nr:HD domain-containing protein [Planctomycetota bacterium]
MPEAKPSPPLSPALADLADGDEFEGFYVVRESSLQTAVNGRNYIRLTLADASGGLPGNIWDANRELFLNCQAGAIVKVQGAAESYKGKPQVKIFRFRPAHESEVEPDHFLPKSKRDIGAMRDELLALADGIRDPDYLALAKAFFHDPAFMDRFARSPAAREVHHAWVGGLLEHTLGIANMAKRFAETTKVNRDLLLLGALLHDAGKIEEFSAKTSIEYSDSGKLLGHLYLGAEMLGRRAAAIPGFPAEKLILLQHLILSHHGRLEYGSPVLPKTPEAFALHHLDNLDAKVETANRLLDAIPDPDCRWSEYNRALEVSLFRAGGRRDGI